MKIKNLRSHSMAAWKDMFCEIDSAKHWKEGRSAESLAKFILAQEGEKEIVLAVNSVLHNDKVAVLTDGIIEFSCPFDRYPTPRRQDMGIWGKTVNGKSLFIGIEAKVDESFGPTISEAISAATDYQAKHPKSKRLARIKELCESFGVSTGEAKSFRYQLFHFAAGTANVPGVDIRIMLTLVFKTSKYNNNQGCQNKLDYDQFINRFFEGENGRRQLKRCAIPARPYAIYRVVDLHG